MKLKGGEVKERYTEVKLKGTEVKGIKEREYKC